MARSKKDKELFDMLRARGLRKKVAKTIASATGKQQSGGRVPAPVRNALGELQSAIGEVERRVTGKQSKRSEAAAKAARTRKRQAAKRSAAAKKGARTRARSGR